MASSCAVSFGAISVSTFCICGSVLQVLRFEKTGSMRTRICPERSSATTVFSNVGGCGLCAMAATSASCCCSAAANAGR
jgi:hypothetical protein